MIKHYVSMKYLYLYFGTDLLAYVGLQMLMFDWK